MRQNKQKRSLIPEHLFVRPNSIEFSNPVIINRKNKIQLNSLGPSNNIFEDVRKNQSFEIPPPSPRQIKEIGEIQDYNLRRFGQKVNFSVEGLVDQLNNKFIEIPKYDENGIPLLDNVTGRPLKEIKSLSELLKNFNESVLAGKSLLSQQRGNIINNEHQRLINTILINSSNMLHNNVFGTNVPINKNAFVEFLNFNKEVLEFQMRGGVLPTLFEENLSLYKFGDILRNKKLFQQMILELVKNNVPDIFIYNFLTFMNINKNNIDKIPIAVKFLESNYNKDLFIDFLKKISVGKKQPKETFNQPFTSIFDEPEEKTDLSGSEEFVGEFDQPSTKFDYLNESEIIKEYKLDEFENIKGKYVKFTAKQFSRIDREFLSDHLLKKTIFSKQKQKEFESKFTQKDFVDLFLPKILNWFVRKRDYSSKAYQSFLNKRTNASLYTPLTIKSKIYDEEKYYIDLTNKNGPMFIDMSEEGDNDDDEKSSELTELD